MTIYDNDGDEEIAINNGDSEEDINPIDLQEFMDDWFITVTI